MKLKAISASLLILLLSTSSVFAQELDSDTAPVIKKGEVDVAQLPEEFLTTLAEVVVSADGKTATVYANKDVRLLKITEALSAVIPDAVNAKKNGWEVLIRVAKPAEGAQAYEIVAFEVKSTVNVLAADSTTPERGFTPIVANTKADIQKMFKSVYPYDSESYDVNDNCFNRAQYWSRMHQVHELKKGSKKGTDKIFIFFTEAYMAKFKHKWWFHVAPAVYLKTKAQPYILDPTFMDSSASISEWLSAFDSHTDGNCIKITNIDAYYKNSEKPVCLYVLASMFNYHPSDLTSRKLTNWRCSDFKAVQEGIPAPGKHTTNPKASWSSKSNATFIPEKCGGPAISIE